MHIQYLSMYLYTPQASFYVYRVPVVPRLGNQSNLKAHMRCISIGSPQLKAGQEQ